MDPSGGQNSTTLPYIGSKISLISNVDIRYEGILYSINTFESTVALQNVRSFGTEGRRQPDIQPNNKTYQFIIFKGKDIKDLTVCEPAAARIPDDPAVVSVNVPPTAGGSSMMSGGPQSQMQNAPMAQKDVMGPGGYGGQSGYGQRSMYGMGPPGRVGNFAGHQGGQGRMPGYPQQQNGPPVGMPMMRDSQGGAFGFGGGRGTVDMYQPRQRGSFGGVMGGPDMDNMMGMPVRGRYAPRGGGRGRGHSRRIVGELPPQPNLAMKKEVSKAFDFEGSNAKFDKSEIKTKTENAADGAENTTATMEKIASRKTGYDKSSSFFDHISCETLDRASGHETRVDRDKQRQLDCETFGPSAAVPRGRSYRRGYRRGGGGGRRGGMGPSAGGYGGYSRNVAPRYAPVNFMQGGGVAGYGNMGRY